MCVWGVGGHALEGGEEDVGGWGDGWVWVWVLAFFTHTHTHTHTSKVLG